MIRPDRLRVLDPRLLLSACAVALAAFALIGWAAFEVSRLHHLDAQVLASLSAHRNGNLAAAVAHLGDPLVQYLVAAAVVILHHHFPSDVIGGFLIAAACTCGVCAVLQ